MKNLRKSIRAGFCYNVGAGSIRGEKERLFSVQSTKHVHSDANARGKRLQTTLDEALLLTQPQATPTGEALLSLGTELTAHATACAAAESREPRVTWTRGIRLPYSHMGEWPSHDTRWPTKGGLRQEARLSCRVEGQAPLRQRAREARRPHARRGSRPRRRLHQRPRAICPSSTISSSSACSSSGDGSCGTAALLLVRQRCRSAPIVVSVTIK